MKAGVIVGCVAAITVATWRLAGVASEFESRVADLERDMVTRREINSLMRDAAIANPTWKLPELLDP